MASSDQHSQNYTHDMGIPSGTLRPQAQARRSTSKTSRAPDLSVEPEKNQVPEKRSKNRKTRSALRRAEQAANGEVPITRISRLRENENIPITRKRHRVPAAVQEEEADAAPAEPPRRQRSQSAAFPEDTTDFGPQNQTEQDAAPTSLSDDFQRHLYGPQSSDAERNAPIFSGARRLLLTARRADNSRNWNERWPLRFSRLRDLRTCRQTFSLHRPAARNPERSHQQQIDRAQDRSHYRNEWNATLCIVLVPDGMQKFQLDKNRKTGASFLSDCFRSPLAVG
jgi:hypothetical protein